MAANPAFTLKKNLRFVSANVADRTEIPPINVNTQATVVYPSVWFADATNVGAKPSVSIPVQSAARSLALLRTSIYNRILQHSLVLNEVLLYLELIFHENPSQATDNWASFGRAICAPGAQVTIENLYNRVDVNDPFDIIDGAAVPASQDLWMTMYLTSIYRICGIENATYRQHVVEVITDRIHARGAPQNINMALVGGTYLGWATDKWYCAMIAIIDMFLAKFPKNALAESRIGTITSRHRDCSAWMDLSFLCSILDADISQVAAWLWSKGLGENFKALIKAGEEVDQIDSYMPYLTDLSLSPKSPYSAAVNPHIHFWVHIIGICLGVARSQNARVVGTINVAGLAAMGMVCGYAYRQRTEAVQQFTETGIPAAGPEDDDDIMVDDEDEQVALPESLDGEDWFVWYQDANFELRPQVQDVIKGIWSRLQETRAGTVGQYARDYAVAGPPE